MTTPEGAPPSERASRFRWVICGLLLTAMVFNYIDRQTLGLLKTDLDNAFGWRERDFATMVSFFSAAYAIAYLFWGRIVDRLGAKIGFAVAFSIWTLGHIAHGLAGAVTGFIVSRVVLGVGEGGAFPAGTKAVAEWFPKKERALATGIFNSGGNIGAIVTPILVPAIVLWLDWRWAFIITGVMGFVWLPLWLALYRRPEAHRASTPPNWRSSLTIHRTPSTRSTGASCSWSEKPGPMPWESSPLTRSGGSTSIGCQTSCTNAMGLISRTLARRWWSSI